MTATDAQLEELLTRVARVQTAAQRFADEMKAQDIHVGLGGAVVRCVTCGRPWPCNDKGGS